MAKIIFTSNVVGHRDIKELQPQPAKNYMPLWFKHMPADVKYDTDYSKIPNFRTAKLCPNFLDIFTEGFVLPAPSGRQYLYESFAGGIPGIWPDGRMGRLERHGRTRS